MSPIAKHFPVMSDEVINHLVKKKNGFYIDCTFGQGGHSKKILEELGSDGRLLAIDVDDDSVAIGKDLEKTDSRFSIVKLNFSEISNYLKSNNLGKPDGIVFDLGFNTGQLVSKGISYKHEDLFLDMRLSSDLKINAANILDTFSRPELARVFKQYGDIKNPGKLINNISTFRKNQGFNLVGDFKKVIEMSCPTGVNKNKFLRQCFLAIRIETNKELDALDKALSSLSEIMEKDGIVALITFHSLEEKIFQNWKRKFCDTILIPDYSKNMTNQFSFLSNACIVPSELEIEENWSSRSAKLWIAKKN